MDLSFLPAECLNIDRIVQKEVFKSLQPVFLITDLELDGGTLLVDADQGRWILGVRNSGRGVGTKFQPSEFSPDGGIQYLFPNGLGLARPALASIVDMAFLQFRNHRTITEPTAKNTLKQVIVPGRFRARTIRANRLDPLPCRNRNDRLVDALIGFAGTFNVHKANVEGVLEDIAKSAHGELTAASVAQSPTVHFFDECRV